MKVKLDMEHNTDAKIFTEDAQDLILYEDSLVIRYANVVANALFAKVFSAMLCFYFINI